MKDNHKLPSESFCIIPWIHMNTWPNGNVFQCCITDYRNNIGNLKDNTMQEIWNNDSMRQLRKDFISGDRPSSCKKCYEQEDNGIISYRNAVNKNFGDEIVDLISATDDDGHNNEFKLKYWDFRFSNLCNMKCRMCGGHLSSLWNNDELELYGRASEPEIVVNTKDHSKEDLYKLIDDQINNVVEIYFAGGEPLIMDEHYYILERLIELKRFDVRLRYNTNLLKIKYKNWDNIELWSHFKSVQVIGSIDATGARGEYVRKGTVWETIDKNIKLLASNDNIMFGISPTINIFNVYHITDLVDYLISAGVKLTEIHLNNVLTNPEWYHVAILTEDLKQQCIQRIQQHLASFSPGDQEIMVNKYNSIISYIKHDYGDKTERFRKKFLDVTDRLDTFRKESLTDACPELGEFYNDLKQRYS